MGLDYHKIQTNEGEILISPSSIAQLFDNAGAWYKVYIKGESKFSGNDNTYLGSLLHNRIEHFYHGRAIDKQEEIDYLEKMNATDQWKIMEALEPMYKQWVKDYGNKYPKPEHIEGAYIRKPSDDIVIGGSIDAIQGDAVIDWKTSSKSKSSIADYRQQLYAYAWILRGNGFTVNNVRIVNIVKPTAKGEVKVNVLDEPINEEYMASFIKQLQLKVKAIRLAKEDDSMAELLFMDNPYSYRV